MYAIDPVQKASRRHMVTSGGNSATPTGVRVNERYGELQQLKGLQW
jgi:hypothetical protein